MRGDFLKSFATGFAMLGVLLLALSGVMVLGKYYTGELEQWGVKQPSKETAGTTPVASEQGQSFKLNPVVFYFVQTGVFSDQAGAAAGAEPLTKAGYRPYVTRESPYRVYLGVFGSREKAVAFQGQLKDRGIGGFIQTVVLNSREIMIDTGRSQTDKDLQSLLEEYTAWFQENSLLWQQVSFPAGERGPFDSMIDRVNNTFHKLPGHMKGQVDDPDFRDKLDSLYNVTGQYVNQLAQMRKGGDENTFWESQRQFSRVIESYSFFILQIENLRKT